MGGKIKPHTKNIICFPVLGWRCLVYGAFLSLDHGRSSSSVILVRQEEIPGKRLLQHPAPTHVLFAGAIPRPLRNWDSWHTWPDIN